MAAVTRLRAFLRASDRRLAVLAFVVLLIVSLASGVAISVLAERLLTEWVLSNAAARAEGLAYGPHLQDFFDAPLTSRAREMWGREFARQLAAVPEVVRVKVWGTDSSVLWSDEPDLIGQRFPQNRDLQGALRGKTRAELEHLTAPEHVYEAGEHRALGEIYVPVRSRSSGRILGVLEVYVKVDRVLALAGRLRTLILSVSLLGGLVAYVLVLWLAPRGAAPTPSAPAPSAV